MPRKWRVRFAGAQYHITQRGNGRQDIFERVEDCERFLAQLRSASEADSVRVLAYVVMTNHYHLFVETPHGNISRFMQRLNTAYGMYYRYKRRKPGHCFQGRYGAKLVGGEGYGLRVTRYIHLNPVWTKAVQVRSVVDRVNYLNRYPWSSYRGYAGLAKLEDWVDYRFLGEMDRKTDQGRREAYRQYAEGMVGAEDEVMTLAKGRSVYAIGDDRFVEETESDVAGVKIGRAVTGDVTWPIGKRPGMDEVLEQVCRELEIDPSTLREDGRLLGDRKGLVLEALCRVADVSQRAVAARLGLASEHTVSYQRRRLVRRMEADPRLRRQLNRLISQFSSKH